MLAQSASWSQLLLAALRLVTAIEGAEECKEWAQGVEATSEYVRSSCMTVSRR